MNYLMIKLGFDTAVHFGLSDSAQSLYISEDHFCADTLFSALCHTAMQMGGEDSMQQLFSWVRDGSLLLSDSMPWCDEEYYLPKPCYFSPNKRDVPANQRKAMKKMAWIPISSFSAFLDSVHGEKSYDVQADIRSFGSRFEHTRVKMRNNNKDTKPYRVGMYQFDKNCGLYIIAGLKTEQQEQTIIRLFRSLGMSGIGGKISSGCGRFHLEDTILLNEHFDAQTKWMYEALINKAGPYLLISSSLPKDDELDFVMEDAAYQLIRRSGFVGSDTYAISPMKKKTQYFLKAGATLKHRYNGDLYSVGKGGKHPVYRYGKPLFLGVDL